MSTNRVRESPEPSNSGVVYQTPSDAVFRLRPVGAQRFDSEHTGLTTRASSRSPELRLAGGSSKQALGEAGIAHGDVQDLTDAGIASLSSSIQTESTSS